MNKNRKNEWEDGDRKYEESSKKRNQLVFISIKWQMKNYSYNIHVNTVSCLSSASPILFYTYLYKQTFRYDMHVIVVIHYYEEYLKKTFCLSDNNLKKVSIAAHY